MSVIQVSLRGGECSLLIFFNEDKMYACIFVQKILRLM